MNNDQEIILAKISAVYDKPPFVKMETGQMEMIAWGWEHTTISTESILNRTGIMEDFRILLNHIEFLLD